MVPKVPLYCLPLLAAACASAPAAPPVYLNRDVQSVVVLPSFNETITEDAWKTAWPHLIEAVATRGYRVVTKEDVEAFYRKNNFNATPEEINLYSAQDLAKEFKTDAVLYSNIVKWGYTYVGVYSEYGVALDLKLVDGRTGEAVWQGQAAASRKQGLEGGNLGGLIISFFAVAGNAFLRSSDAWAGECVGTGIRKLPLAGYAPGTNPYPAPSTESPETKPPEENP